MVEPVYESGKAISEYLLFHYGKPKEILPYPGGPHEALDFAVRCVTECVDHSAVPPGCRALDLGCAVGRSSFELARFCQEVIGIDYSHRFVEAAERLRADGVMAFDRRDEGELSTRLKAERPPGVSPDRVRFFQGDAQALPEELGSFDVVLAANLIDRLTEPARFLARLPSLVRTDGQLVITSPYTWLEEFTPVEHWLGGRVVDGVPIKTLEALKRHLTGDFELMATRDLPFLIREHARKFQWSVAQASVWRRR
jgi:putative 4-mercaptohistidine N1-methyltranferase